MQNKIIYILSGLLFVSILSLIIMYIKSTESPSEDLDIRKVRNLEFKGNYYFQYNRTKEPLDIMNIFFNEFEINKSQFYRDSLIRFWRIEYLSDIEYNDIKVSVFEFGKLNFEYNALVYKMVISTVEPFYIINNTSVKFLPKKNDLALFINDFLSYNTLDISNKDFVIKPVNTDTPNTPYYYIETLKDNRYNRILLSGQPVLGDSLNEGNKIITWFYKEVKSRYDYDLFVGN